MLDEEPVEYYRIDAEDVVETLKALEDLAEVSKRVSELYSRYRLYTRVKSWRLGIDRRTEARIEVQHLVYLSLESPTVVSVEKLEKPVQYVLKDGELMLETDRPVLKYTTLIHIDSPNLKDFILLAAYEKLEGLVTRLIEEVYKVSKEDAQKLEKLRAVVNAVKDLVNIPT